MQLNTNNKKENSKLYNEFRNNALRPYLTTSVTILRFVVSYSK